MRTKERLIRYTAFVQLIFVLFGLSGCGKTYPIHDYAIDQDKHPGWYVCEKSNFVEHLDVHYSYNLRSGQDPVENATYLVFDSSASARSYFNNCLDECKEEGTGIKERGLSWFIAKVPHTYDCDITGMYYLDKNVVIYAEVYITTYSTLGDTSSKDKSDMKKYILKNHSEMRDFVMELFS